MVERAQIAIAILPGIGTKLDLESARDAGASVARVSTVCTEADIGVQHLGLARELGMVAHSHLNTAHLLDAAGTRRAGAGSSPTPAARASTSSTRPARSCPTTSAAGSRRCATALPADVAVGIHEHNNLSLAVANSAAAIEEGATLVDTSLAGLGAGAGQQPRPRRSWRCSSGWASRPGIDLWALQDVADEVVRGEVMQRPIEIDRLTATMGYAAVPASYLLHAIRAGRAVRPRSARHHRRARPAQGRRRPGGRDHRHRGRDGRRGRASSMISVVLDDDPTGTQAMSGVSIVLDWSDGAIAAAIRDGDPSVHVLTNSRAHTGGRGVGADRRPPRAPRAPRFPPRACCCVATARCGLTCGRSTRRSARTIAPDVPGVPLLLVPALPAAGRVTLDGVHLLERDGARVPLHRTEYATRRRSRVRRARASRAGRTSAAADGSRRATRSRSRSPSVRARRGGDAVAAGDPGGLRARPSGGRRPDAETDADLEMIACGLRAAEADDAGRSRAARPPSPAILTGTAATGRRPLPAGERGVLVLCGSFVPGTTAQLEALSAAQPGIASSATCAHSPATPGAVRSSGSPTRPRERVSRARGVAVVATVARARPGARRSPPASGGRRALARVARLVPAGVVIAKGGITSAVTARDGLGARSARVVGPIADRRRRSGRLAPAARPTWSCPGNVGGPRLLAELVVRSAIPAWHGG